MNGFRSAVRSESSLFFCSLPGLWIIPGIIFVSYPHVIFLRYLVLCCMEIELTYVHKSYYQVRNRGCVCKKWAAVGVGRPRRRRGVAFSGSDAAGHNFI